MLEKDTAFDLELLVGILAKLLLDWDCVDVKYNNPIIKARKFKDALKSAGKRVRDLQERLKKQR